jgi:hypothetical protein
MVGRLPLIAMLMCAFFLTGCPPTPPPRQLSIKVTNISMANSNGGLSFLVSGTGFTPNGQVGIRVFNVPGNPYADFANLPGLPILVADPSGNFANFRVAAPCLDTYPPDVISQGKNAELWVTDVTTISIAKQMFPPIACDIYPIGHNPSDNPPRVCPADIPQSQCH